MIFNGDVLSGLDLNQLLSTHRTSKADVTLYLTRVADSRAFGCVPTDAEGRVTAFLEKDPNPITDQINAGTYVFRRDVLEQIPAGYAVSVERETFPGLLADGGLLMGHIDTRYWRDMGTPADFVAGSADLVRGVAPTGALPGPTGAALFLPGAHMAADAFVTGGSTVGRNVHIGAGATVDGSVLFDGARVGPGAVVRRSVLGRQAVIGAGSVVADAVIGDRAWIGAGNELLGGIRIWPDMRIDDRAVRFSAST
jgi:mannose-1-phosphate guanylyltransferase